MADLLAWRAVKAVGAILVRSMHETEEPEDFDIEIYVWCWQCSHPSEAYDGRLCSCCGSEIPDVVDEMYYDGAS